MLIRIQKDLDENLVATKWGPTLLRNEKKNENLVVTCKIICLYKFRKIWMITCGHQVDTTFLRNEQELKQNLVAICRITMFMWIQKDLDESLVGNR
jgi:hypothetical protein